MGFNKVPNVPGSPGLSALLKVSIIGGLGVYAISNSLYNVEGGHRAVMFNRLTGIKEKVKIGLRVLTRPMGDRLPQIYRTLGQNYSERVVMGFYHWSCSNNQ